MKKRWIGWIVGIVFCFLPVNGVSAGIDEDIRSFEQAIASWNKEIASLREYRWFGVPEKSCLETGYLDRLSRENQQRWDQVLISLGKSKGEEVRKRLAEIPAYQPPAYFVYFKYWIWHWVSWEDEKALDHLIPGENQLAVGVYGKEGERVWMDANHRYLFPPLALESEEKVVPGTPLYALFSRSHEQRLKLIEIRDILSHLLEEAKIAKTKAPERKQEIAEKRQAVEQLNKDICELEARRAQVRREREELLAQLKELQALKRQREERVRVQGEVAVQEVPRDVPEAVVVENTPDRSGEEDLDQRFLKVEETEEE